MSVSVNVASCMRDRAFIGYDEIHNVCTGEIYRLDWTIGNWAGMGAGVLFILFCLTMIVLIARI